MLLWDTIALLLPALVVGMMVLLTHIALGQEVLKRGIIFIDLAVAQAAALGLVIASLLHVEHGLLKELLAITGAIAAALLFRKSEKTMPEFQEAFIGVFYVCMATLSLLLLSHHPHGAEQFNTLLSGEMLFVSWQDILHHLPIYILAMAVWHGYSGAKKGLIFYLLFALVITSSVQLVGVFMVFTALITPSLMLSLTGMHWLHGYLISVAALVIGLTLSTLTDYPASQCVILCITLACMLGVYMCRLYKS